MTVYSFEPSGKLKLPTQEELLRADEEYAILTFSRGTLDDGRPYWAYIAVKPSLYRKFYELSTAHQPIPLHDYGTVIASDYVAEPPPDIVREMEERFGFDTHYADKIVAEINQQQHVFLEKREEQRIMDIVTMLKKKNPQ